MRLIQIILTIVILGLAALGVGAYEMARRAASRSTGLDNQISMINARLEALGIALGNSNARLEALGNSSRASSDSLRTGLDNQISMINARLEALGIALGNSNARLEALGIALGNSSRASSDSLRLLDRATSRLQDEMTAISFGLGALHNPSDIVIGERDTYDNLDRNWQTMAHPRERKSVLCTIEEPRNRTAVVVTLGQSNAANTGAGLYAAKRRVDNFDLYDGKCYRAADPLLGTSGAGGNFATRLGDMLVERGLFDRVILAPIAMGGTFIEQWADEGIFNRRIPVLIRRLYDAGLTADFILWHQGEANTGLTEQNARLYRKNLLEVVRTFRKYNVMAPFFIALATTCGARGPNMINIREGQRSTVNPQIGTYLGPDTDAFGPDYRQDDECHFNEAGLAVHATAWADVIDRYLRQSTLAGNSDRAK